MLACVSNFYCSKIEFSIGNLNYLIEFYITILKTMENTIKPQYNKTNKETKNRAIAILKEGFKKQKSQMIDGDIDQLVILTGRHKNTVCDCVNGKVRDFNTGSVILTELKKMIANREFEARQLVA